VATAVGIRREDKSRWERRVPLTPADVSALTKQGIPFLVQSSPIRVYPDNAYLAAGAEVVENLDAADIIMAVKEVPIKLLRPNKTYAFFSHVIKGQPYNMPMLARLLELGCSLVDYERIVDDEGQRLIFFGIHAGYAGMLETLWALGERLLAQGIQSPLAEVRHAYEYDGLHAAMAHLRDIGNRMTVGDRPLVFGIAGYGNVSRGAREILACLPRKEIAVVDLPIAANQPGPAIIEVVFKEEDMVRARPPNDTFELQDYYDHPERYDGAFESYLPHLDVLVNTIYWEERYPRLVTRTWADKQLSAGQTRLQVIGDISCDIRGGVEITLVATQPDAPCFLYQANADKPYPGTKGHGIAVMSVDNLPCELPHEASQYFGNTLRDMMPALVSADWQADFDALELPAPLKNAVIVHKGELTPNYRYLQQPLRANT